MKQYLGHDKIVQLLIDKGADVNQKASTILKFTPLQLAAAKGTPVTREKLNKTDYLKKKIAYFFAILDLHSQSNTQQSLTSENNTKESV